jgi:hypothetical protein
MAVTEVDPAQAARLERELIVAVSRRANTVDYLMSEIKKGERRAARRVFKQLLGDKILMTVEGKLLLPPA